MSWRAGFSLLALVLGFAAPLSTFNSAVAQSAPLSCMGTIYGVDTTGQLFSIDTTSHVTTPVPGGIIGHNGLGVSSGGLFTYSVTGTNVFVHNVSTGVVQQVPFVSDGFIIIRGAVNPLNGFYYFADNNSPNEAVYAYDPNTSTMIGKVGHLSPDVPHTGINGDFAFDNAGNLFVTMGDHIYRAVSAVPTTPGDVTINLTALAVLQAGADSPGIAFASDGYLYVNDDPVVGPTTVFKIDPSSGAGAGTFTIPNFPVNDLGSCATPNTLTLKVDVQGRVQPTDEFTMTITGSGVAMGNTATTTGTNTGVQTEVAGPVLTLPGQSYTVTQTAAGTTDLNTYTTTWQCSDVSSGTPVPIPGASGTGNTGTFTYPTPTGSNGSNVQCVFTNTPLAPPVATDSKSVSPASTTQVDAGQQLTYTLTFTGPGAVNRVDDLAEVLDDATVTSPPVSSDPALTVGAVSNNQFTIAGTLTAGQTVTVIFTVMVNPDGQRGNDRLDNFLLNPGQTPPATCLPTDNHCTTNPVTPAPVATDSKSVSPASTTQVDAGQHLTYTLTFAGPGAVNRVDDLAGVLDDATITSSPVSSDPALTVGAVSNNEFAITGTLTAGQTVTVIFTVLVNQDGHRGNNRLDNFLLNPGEIPPATCLPTNTHCTTNPVLTALARSGSYGQLPIVIGAGVVLLTGSSLLAASRRSRRVDC